MKPVCAALGCGKTSGPKASFCRRHLDALPAGLRDPADARAARTFLGRKDGYLADTPGLRRGAFKAGDLHDNEGTEYV